jgi:hypothetical protein
MMADTLTRGLVRLLLPRRSVVTLLAAKVDLYYPPANPAKPALIRRTSY